MTCEHGWSVTSHTLLTNSYPVQFVPGILITGRYGRDKCSGRLAETTWLSFLLTARVCGVRVCVWYTVRVQCKTCLCVYVHASKDLDDKTTLCMVLYDGAYFSVVHFHLTVLYHDCMMEKVLMDPEGSSRSCLKALCLPFH